MVAVRSQIDCRMRHHGIRELHLGREVIEQNATASTLNGNSDFDLKTRCLPVALIKKLLPDFAPPGKDTPFHRTLTVFANQDAHHILFPLHSPSLRLRLRANLQLLQVL